MKSNDDHASDVKELTEMLIRLRPARCEIDTRALFYEAGYSASQNHHATPSATMMPVLLAATLLSAMVAVPAAYLFGQRAAVQAERLTAQDSDASGAGDDIKASDKPFAEESAQPPSLTHSASTQPDPSNIDLPHSASWSDPLSDVVAASRLQRQSQATLSVSHRSLLVSEDRGQDWLSFPPATALANFRAAIEVGNTGDNTLTVSDLRQVAKHWEGSR